MRLQLTHFLLNFLIEEEYRYFLVKNVDYPSQDYDWVTLIPISKKPETARAPLGFDSCIKITKQLLKMYGEEDAKVIVKIDHELIHKLKYSILYPGTRRLTFN